MMALSGNDKRSASDVGDRCAAEDILPSLHHRDNPWAWQQPILGFEPPVALDRLIDLLAKAAAPCALFAMGATLALRPLKRIPKELYLIVPLEAAGSASC